MLKIKPSSLTFRLPQKSEIIEPNEDEQDEDDEDDEQSEDEQNEDDKQSEDKQNDEDEIIETYLDDLGNRKILHSFCKYAKTMLPVLIIKAFTMSEEDNKSSFASNFIQFRIRQMPIRLDLDNIPSVSKKIEFLMNVKNTTDQIMHVKFSDLKSHGYNFILPEETIIKLNKGQSIKMKCFASVSNNTCDGCVHKCISWENSRTDARFIDLIFDLDDCYRQSKREVFNFIMNKIKQV